MNAEAFQGLLARLAPDTERASHEYEMLRRRLIDFFDWRGTPSPEARADETLDRVARKLQQGVIVEQVAGYARGVARHVLLESHRSGARERVMLHTLVALTPPATRAEDEDETRSLCLRDCLSALSPENRQLILAYYESDARAHLSERMKLAEQRHVSYGALRVRVHRLRGTLEGCLRGCLARGGPVTKRAVGATSE